MTDRERVIAMADHCRQQLHSLVSLCNPCVPCMVRLIETIREEAHAAP